MNIAAKWLAVDRNYIAAVLGGYRKQGLSEAEVYQQWFQSRYQHLSPQINHAEASLTYTAGDLCKAAQYLRVKAKDGYRLVMVSNRHHILRANLTLTWLGLPEAIPEYSGECPDNSPERERLLYHCTKLDPGWRHLALPLVWLANRRANERYLGINQYS